MYVCMYVCMYVYRHVPDGASGVDRAGPDDGRVGFIPVKAG